MKSTRLSLNKQLLRMDLAPIFGADGEGEGAGGEGGAGAGSEQDKDKGGEGGAGGSDDADKDKSGSEGGDPQKKIAAQQEEIDRHYAARKAAEKERDDLKAKQEEQDRQKRTKEENLERDLQTATTERDQLAEQNQRLLVQVAFLGTNDVQWHNPERALALVDLSNVEIKDGKVDTKALKAAIDALAKSDAYLVKTDSTDDKDRRPPGGRTGDTSGGAGAGGKKPDPDRQKLLQRYPSLRNR